MDMSIEAEDILEHHHSLRTKLKDKCQYAHLGTNRLETTHLVRHDFERVRHNQRVVRKRIRKVEQEEHCYECMGCILVALVRFTRSGIACNGPRAVARNAIVVDRTGDCDHCVADRHAGSADDEQEATTQTLGEERSRAGRTEIKVRSNPIEKV